MVNPVNKILGKENCPKCGSSQTLKIAHNQLTGQQKFQCVNCNSRWSTNEYD